MIRTKPAKKIKSFSRSIEAIQHEIAYQILFAELAFDICKSIPIIHGKGNDLAPYFYNLNFSKAILALHSLLLSQHPEEISFKNYFNQYNWEYKHKIETNSNLKEKIEVISNRFKKIYKPSLRHKVAAHISQGYKHTDFTNAYLIPDLIDPLSKIVADLKEEFFIYNSYSRTEDPFREIKEQVKEFLNL